MITLRVPICWFGEARLGMLARSAPHSLACTNRAGLYPDYFICNASAVGTAEAPRFAVLSKKGANDPVA